MSISGVSVSDLLGAPFEVLGEPVRCLVAADRQVVAIVGSTVPAEEVVARGAVPVYLAPRPSEDTPLANQYIESESWRARSIVEQALDGRLDGASLLVLTRGSEWIYYTLKEVVRRGDGPAVPPLYMHDYVPTRSEAADAYNSGRMEALREALDRAVGVRTTKDLQQAAELVEERRGLFAELQRLRDERRVAGTVAQRVIAASHARDVRDSIAPLRSLIDEVGSVSPSTAPRALLISAEPSDTPDVHAAVEAGGLRVVAEDSWWGSRGVGSAMPPLNDLEHAVDSRLKADISGRDVSPRPDREAWVRGRISGGDIDVVVFHIPPSDLLFGWDYPKLKAHAEAHGVRTVLLPYAVDDPAAAQAIREDISAITHGART